MKKVTTFLTFKERAEEAVNFYVSLFPSSKITSLTRYQASGPMRQSALLNATFELDGQEFMAMDGGPHFTFAEGTSMFVSCETQDEVDRLWAELSDGGEEQPCGWVKDRYGLSWQIVPTVLGELMQGPDAEASRRVMEALLRMSKIDIETLRRAYEQGQSG